MDIRLDQFQGMLSPWRDRDDFDDYHDEVMHLVKGRNRNHGLSVVLETENRKQSQKMEYY